MYFPPNLPPFPFVFSSMKHLNPTSKAGFKAAIKSTLPDPMGCSPGRYLSLNSSSLSLAFKHSGGQVYKFELELGVPSFTLYRIDGARGIGRTLCALESDLLANYRTLIRDPAKVLRILSSLREFGFDIKLFIPLMTEHFSAHEIASLL